MVPARQARAANNFFNVASGNYATGTNWTLGTIPGNGNNDQPWIGTTVGGLTTAAATYNTATVYTTTGRFVVGLGAGGNGTLTMNGSAGTLTFGGDNFGGANYVGVDGGTGFMNVDAGTLSISAGAYLWVGANGSGVGTLSVNGGTINMGTGSVLGLGTGNAAGANGTLNMNSGAINFSTTAGLVINGVNAAGSAGTAVANLNGGIITTPSVSSGGTGSATLNLAGGTLKANATNAAFISGMDAINVKNGGVTFDSNGFNIGVSQVLAHFAGATTDGLTKTGNGTLTLSSANTFNGNVVINGGTLTSNLPAPAGVSTSGGFGNLQVAGKTITVNSGATLLHSANDLYFNSTLADFNAMSTKIVIAGGTLNTGSFYSSIKDLDINSGGSITGTNGVNANFRSLAITGTVTTNGGTGVGSTIASPGGFGGIHLGHSSFAVSNVTFNVDAASGGLTISAPLYNQAGALGASGFTKTGSGTLTLTNTTSAFTGNVLINQGQVIVNGGGLGLNPTTSALGNTQTAGRTITVSNATLAFTQHDVLGNAASTPVVQVILNSGGDLQSQSKLTTLGPVTLNGGTLTADGDQNVGQFGNFNLNGTVTVNGSTQSELRATNVTAGAHQIQFEQRGNQHHHV